MAEAIQFSGANMLLRAPAAMRESVNDLWAFTNGKCSVSCWQLSPDEIEEVARTGKIFLSVFSGSSQPPVVLGSEESVRAVVADSGGVWKREAVR